MKHDLVQKDSPLLNILKTPVSVFVTWETEEGFQRALTWNDSPQCKVLG